MRSYEQSVKPVKLQLAKHFSFQLVDGCVGSIDSGGGLFIVASQGTLRSVILLRAAKLFDILVIL
jgi:hypothetical protein